jgi:hypothetical protein
LPSSAYAEKGWERVAREAREHSEKRSGRLRTSPPKTITLGTEAASIIDPSFVRAEASKLGNAEEWLKKYDSRTLGEMIVQRLHTRVEYGVNCPECIPYNKYEDSQVVLQFHSKDLPIIVEKGFLNFHQTGKSGGGKDTTSRVLSESEIIGYEIGNIVESEGDGFSDGPGAKVRPGDASEAILPKYAYVELTSDVKFENSKAYSAYGDVFAVLKSEVKRRTTWTIDDSVEAKDRHLFTGQTFFGDQLPAANREKARYLEAQVWGELDLRDVSHFLVKKGSTQNLEELKKTGIPIYELRVETLGRYSAPTYSGSNPYSRQVHRKERLLYSGDPAKLSEYRKSLVHSRRAPSAAILEEIRKSHLEDLVCPALLGSP